MSTATQETGAGASWPATEILISADSHVMEPPDLWTTRVPQSFRSQAPQFPPHKVGAGLQAHAGAGTPTSGSRRQPRTVWAPRCCTRRWG